MSTLPPFPGPTTARPLSASMEAWSIRLTSSSTAPSRRWLAAKLCPPDTTLTLWPLTVA
ncbi:Uncharacterised protein [Mycobacterium tuberculosis]|nr:Uncharacterised protein [Mycobacterium tuberculosis]